MLRFSIIDQPESEIKNKSVSISLVSRVIGDSPFIKTDFNTESIKFNALRTINEVHFIGLSSEILNTDYLEINKVNDIPQKLTFKLINREDDFINNREIKFLKSQVKKNLVSNLRYKSKSIFLNSSILQGITNGGSNFEPVIGRLKIVLEVKRYEYTEFRLPEGYLEGLLPSKYAYAVGDVLKVRSTRLGETILYTNKGTITLVTIPGIKVDNTEFNLPEVPNDLPITQLEVATDSDIVEEGNSLTYNLVTEANDYEFSFDTPDIVSIDKDAKIINALKPGNVTITFTAKADYKFPNSIDLNIEVTPTGVTP